MIVTSRQEAVTEVNSHLSEYLRSIGINIRANFNCLNDEHKDSDPSMSYDKKANKCHCFGCNATYDLIDLLQRDNRCDFNTALEIGCKMYNIDIDKDYYNRNKSVPASTPKPVETKANNNTSLMDYTADYKEWHTHLQETDYLIKRGIPQELCNYFNIGYVHWKWKDSKQNKWRESPFIVFPCSKHYYNSRRIDYVKGEDLKGKKPSNDKSGGSVPFNYAALINSDKPIFIVEGEIDALSIMAVSNSYNAIGLGGAKVQTSLVDFLRQAQPKNPLIIALDNDDAGKEGSRELSEKLTDAGIKHIIADSIYTGIEGVHDANELLLADKEELKQRVIQWESAALNMDTVDPEVEETLETQQLSEYNKTVRASDKMNLLDIDYLKENSQSAISTGFKSVDNAIDGGFYKGLYVLGAVTSLGKTTLCLNIANNIAAAGHDVLYISLEMDSMELIGKSVSRLTYLLAEDPRHAKKYRDIVHAENISKYSLQEKQLLEKSKAEFFKIAEHLYIKENFLKGSIGRITVNDVKNAIEEHISITHRTPIVFIDYLQILAPRDPHMTDKQCIDDSIWMLKQLTKDFNLPIIAVSSLNREGYWKYKGKVVMEAFKESGAIEYTVDVLMGLQYAAAGDGFTREKEQEEQSKEIRELAFVVLKNRHGKRERAIPRIDFNPAMNCFIEKKNPFTRKSTSWMSNNTDNEQSKVTRI